MEGDVDERSIKDVQPNEIEPYTRIHLFAAIANWDLALQLARWPADRPVLTNSCPCQSFSCAGKQAGGDDPRHLWPEVFRLIRGIKARPVIGEQVEAAIRHGWIDGVFGDMETQGHTCGAVILGAHSVRAPHIRQRLYWLAIPEGQLLDGSGDSWRERIESANSGAGDRLADDPGYRREQRRPEPDWWSVISNGSGSDGLGLTDSPGRLPRESASAPAGHRNTVKPASHDGSWMDESNQSRPQGHPRHGDDRYESRWLDPHPAGPTPETGESGGLSDTLSERTGRPGQTFPGSDREDDGISHPHGGEDIQPNPWSQSLLLQCRDSKSRRVPSLPIAPRQAPDAQPRVQPLVDDGKSLRRPVARSGSSGSQELQIDPELFPLSQTEPGRVGLLRGAGNCINPYLAAEFIMSYMESL